MHTELPAVPALRRLNQTDRLGVDDGAVVPLNTLKHTCRLPEDQLADWLVEESELGPSVRGVLVLEFHNEDVILPNENSIWLTPPGSLRVREAKPRT